MAFISLLLIGTGLILSFCRREMTEAPSVVIEMPEMKESEGGEVSAEQAQGISSKKKKSSAKGNSDKKKSKKTYRKRSPLDEPV